MAESDSLESSNTTPPPESKPPLPEYKSWADEAEEDIPEETNAALSSASVSSLNVDNLAIDENRKATKFLDEPDDSNIKTVTSGVTPYTSASTFGDLNLSLNPPHKDLIAQAHNGSGKTTCFVLGMLSRVDPKMQAPQALCICPTRELTIQNTEVLRKMGKYTGISSECAIAADSRDATPISKRAPIMAQVVIGTPGTIKRWMT